MVIFLQFLADFVPHLESNFVHMKDLYVQLGYVLQRGGTSLHAYNFQEKQVNTVININYHIFRTWNFLQCNAISECHHNVSPICCIISYYVKTYFVVGPLFPSLAHEIYAHAYGIENPQVTKELVKTTLIGGNL